MGPTLMTTARFWILLLISSTLLSAFIGSHALVDVDEGRNAEVAREMAASGDYLVPTINTLPYIDKPILYFALSAAAMDLFGVSETAARFPSLLFTIATVILVSRFVRKWLSERAGEDALLILVSMPFVIAFSRIVIFDSAVMFFVTAANLAFFAAVEQRREGKHSPVAIVAWIAIALGILTKGPIALLLPLLTMIPFSIIRRAPLAIWNPAGVLVAVAIVAPWVVAMQAAVPDYIQYVALTETYERLTTDELQRTGPVWYFAPLLLAAAFPWIFAAADVHRWKKRIASSPIDLLAILWIVLPFIFFSLSQSKRPQYLLPILPAIAILIVSRWTDEERRGRDLRRTAVVLLVTALLLGVGLVAGALERLSPAIRDAASTSLPIIVLAVAAAGIAALFAPRSAAIVIALSVLLLPSVAQPLVRAVAASRSTKAMAQVIKPHLERGVAFVTVSNYQPSLAFYLQRPLLLATDNARELTSNYILRRHTEFTRNPDAPLKPLHWFEMELRRCPQPTLFLGQKRDTGLRVQLIERLPIIAENRRSELFGPCRPVAGGE